jgi:hypothetical protein
MQKAPNICINDGCDKARKGRNRRCSACVKKIYIEKDPVRYAYQTTKDNAKRRGKEFTISLEYFRKFCVESEYIKKKGITAKSFTIDRKDNTKGYVEGNLQVLTNGQNVIKKMLDKRLAAEQGQYKVFQINKKREIKKDANDEVPF